MSELTTEQVPDEHQTLGVVSVTLRIDGPRSANDLAAALADIPGVLSISSDETDRGD